MNSCFMKAVIHYSEIALKGKNKQYFVDRLITNIKEKIPFVEHINKKETKKTIRSQIFEK